MQPTSAGFKRFKGKLFFRRQTKKWRKTEKSPARRHFVAYTTPNFGHGSNTDLTQQVATLNLGTDHGHTDFQKYALEHRPSGLVGADRISGLVQVWFLYGCITRLFHYPT